MVTTTAPLFRPQIEPQPQRCANGARTTHAHHSKQRANHSANHDSESNPSTNRGHRPSTAARHPHTQTTNAARQVPRSPAITTEINTTQPRQ